MGNSERVKLTADIIDAAGKHDCIVPKDVIKDILNDPDNRKALGYDGDFIDVTQVVSEAKRLLSKREKAVEEYY